MKEALPTYSSPSESAHDARSVQRLRTRIRAGALPLLGALALLLLFISVLSMVSCAPKRGSGVSAELVGVGLASWSEPAPYGMVQIPQGHIVLGEREADTVWGLPAEYRAISVDAFWMDQTEVTNAQWRQFVYYVRDSIVRERLADPLYGGNPLYKITTDKYGDPVKPYLDWSQPLPTPKRALEQELEAMESVYYTNPVTGERKLDPKQMLYKYEVYDYHAAALYRNNLQKEVRASKGVQEPVMISKDTAYVNDRGEIIRETITRQLASEYDFLNTYIVAIYPDETVWVNDYPNSKNEIYTRTYFNHPRYDNHPVVGISWEQATAFCHWRTDNYRKGLNLPDGAIVPEFRLPTEAEWEYAARAGRTNTKFPWNSEDLDSEDVCFLANFKPFEGDYAADGQVITSQVSTFSPNDYGLYDMAGNVAEWTSSSYFVSSYEMMDDVNPQMHYNAAREDNTMLRRKVAKGGSWKDVLRFIRSTRRIYAPQDEAHSYIGFRCVRSIINNSK